ncbi:MAG: MerC domain-containing protein [Alphaproteobacteria bacterium]|nr:MerC domain-containing protein [Alphaproteobacteria bacterium]MBU0795503.1 MerC domain-containing protein [Alphaproteobacteria bacterium]MBU0876230.1 MerC domain-containing protein [Alphaproteobacteria bacterium]
MRTLAAPRTWTMPQLDRLAIGLSGLCAVHCLTTAVAVGLLSSLAGIFEAHIIHEGGLAIAMVLGALALGQGARRHGMALPVAIGALGLGIMAGALSLPHGWEGETPYTLLGVALLAFGHELNRRAFW